MPGGIVRALSLPYKGCSNSIGRLSARSRKWKRTDTPDHAIQKLAVRLADGLDNRLLSPGCDTRCANHDAPSRAKENELDVPSSVRRCRDDDHARGMQGR